MFQHSRRNPTRRRYRPWLLFCLAVGLSLCLATSCDRKLPPAAPAAPSVGARAAQDKSQPEWIEQVSPTRSPATPTAPVQIRFQTGLMALKDLEQDPNPSLLQHFQIEPRLPGRWQVLTPRLVSFTPAQAWPIATQVRVTLTPGLADLAQHRLEQPWTWTFQTQPLRLSELSSSVPDGEAEDLQRFGPMPILELTSNAELQLASLTRHSFLIAPDGQLRLPLVLAQPPERRSPQQWRYQLKPTIALAADSRYQFTLEPGVVAQNGNQPTETSVSSSIRTYGPLKFEQLLSQQGPSPLIKGAPELVFNHPLQAESLPQALELTPPPRRRHHQPAQVSQGGELAQAGEGPQSGTQRENQWWTLRPGDRRIQLNPRALLPATRYTLKLKANLQDRYGQQLGKPLTLRFETSDLAPKLLAPSGFSLQPMEPGRSPRLQLTAMNLASYQYALVEVQPTDLVYTDEAQFQPDGLNLLPNPNSWKSKELQSLSNRPTTAQLPLDTVLGQSPGLVAYGVQAGPVSLSPEGGQGRFYGMVQHTNLALVTQWLTDSGWVQVHHLRDGASVGQVEIQVYQSQVGQAVRAQALPCATGRTDANGFLSFSRSALQRCLEPNSEGGQTLLTIAREGADWTYSRAAALPAAAKLGYLWSAQSQYAPGGQVSVVAWVYHHPPGTGRQTRQPVANRTYRLKLTDPNGQVRSLPDQTTNALGNFSLQFPLDSSVPLGRYRLQAQADQGPALTTEFRVVQPLPQPFEASLQIQGLKPSQSLRVQPEGSLQALVQGRYEFGAPILDGRLSLGLVSQSVSFVPSGWEQFHFAPSASTDGAGDPQLIWQTRQALDSQGQAQLSIPLAPPRQPSCYRVNAAVEAGAGQSVLTEQSWLQIPGDRLVGLSQTPEAWVNRELPTQVIVTNAAGAAIAGDPVRLELEPLPEPGQLPQPPLVSTLISAAQPQPTGLVPTAIGRYRLRASHPQGGVSEVDIAVGGLASSAIARDLPTLPLPMVLDQPRYKVGSQATVKLQLPELPGEVWLSVVGDRLLYQTRVSTQTSQVPISFRITPEMADFSQVQALFIPQRLSAAELSRRSNPDLANPGLANPALANPALANPALNRWETPSFRTIPLGVDRPDLRLDLSLATDPQRLPGQPQTLRVQLAQRPRHLSPQAASSAPVMGQVLAWIEPLKDSAKPWLPLSEQLDRMATDLGPAATWSSNWQSLARDPASARTVPTLNLPLPPINPPLPSPPPPSTSPPTKSPLSTGEAELRAEALCSSAVQTSAAVSPPRSSRAGRGLNELELGSQFLGSIPTDAQGQAQFTFTAPSQPGRWRVVAIATDGQLRQNTAETQFVTQQPLAVKLKAPPRVQLGDRFRTELELNQSEVPPRPLQLRSSIAPGLSWDSPAQQDLQPESQQSLQAMVQAKAPGPNWLEATLGPASTSPALAPSTALPPSTSDRQAIEVEQMPHREQASWGQLRPKGKGDRFSLVLPGLSGSVESTPRPDLELVLSTSPQPLLAAAAQAIFTSSAVPFVETAAGQLRLAAVLQELPADTSASGSDFNLAERWPPLPQTVQAIQALQFLRQADGGFARSPGEASSDPLGSALAGQALGRSLRIWAQTPEVAPALNQLSRGLVPYLQAIVAQPDLSDSCEDTQCQNILRVESLLALTQLGASSQDNLSELYSRRQQLDPRAQLKLAQMQLATAGWQQEGNSWLKTLTKQQFSPSSSPLPQRWQAWQSSLNLEATALEVFSQAQMPPKLLNLWAERLTTRLAEQAARSPGISPANTPGTLLEQVNAALALQQYHQRYRQTHPARTRSITLETVDPAGRTAPFTLPLNGDRPLRWQRPKADLTQVNLLQAGRDPIYYWLRGSLQASGPQPGQIQGLRLTRRVLRPDNTLVQTTGLFPSQPLQAKLGQLYRIELEVIADTPIDHIVLQDTLPAGFELVPGQLSVPEGENWQVRDGSNWQQLIALGSQPRDDADASLAPGIYRLRYLVRSSTPGTFSWPSAVAYAQLSPERRGNSATTTVIVDP